MTSGLSDAWLDHWTVTLTRTNTAILSGVSRRQGF